MYSSCSTSTSCPGSLFSASLSRWNRDPGCGWSRDHLSIQNRRVGGYSSTFRRDENPVAQTFRQIFLPPILFRRLRAAEKRDPGNKVGSTSILKNFNPVVFGQVFHILWFYIILHQSGDVLKEFYNSIYGNSLYTVRLLAVQKMSHRIMIIMTKFVICEAYSKLISLIYKMTYTAQWINQNS